MGCGSDPLRATSKKLDAVLNALRKAGLLAKGPRYYGAHGGRGLGKSWYFAGRLVTAVCFSLGLVAQPLAPVLAGESLQAKPTMTKHTIGVEHLRIESGKSFADVRAALERSVPQLDPTLVKALADGD